MNVAANVRTRSSQPSFMPQAPSHQRWERVTSRNHCAVCDHGGFCQVTADGSVAGCMRVSSGAFKTTMTRVGPMFFHRLREGCPPSLRSAPLVRRTNPPTSIASPEHRHRVYTAFLDSLTLSSEHATALRVDRGLSEETVTRNLYASVPEAGALSVRVAHIAEGFALAGVPGFYRDESRWLCVAKPGELLIPARDHRERITALLRRTGGTPKYLWMSKAERGPSCGTPLHFALPHLVALHGHAIITEGLLKADTIAELRHAAVIAIPGVSCFGDDLALNLKEWFPELNAVSIAFDSDEASNPHVRAALVRLVRLLQSAAIAVDVLRWDQSRGKGLDDVLIGGAA